MRLVFRYRWSRLRGRDKAQDLSRQLYREYYQLSNTAHRGTR
jgi:hypothetical protein